jgi:SAM-dependent methyltransferase
MEAPRARAARALEIDPALAAKLRDRLGARAEIVDGDGTAMPFADASFSAAACFTMLHHVPSPELQDRLFAEVRRVLRPGAPFVGTDSTGRGIGFALLHIGDTKVVIDPTGLEPRLRAAGFEDVAVVAERNSLRFHACRARA